MMKNIRTFPLRSGARQVCPFLPLLFNIVFGSPSHNNQRRKRNKKNPDWKRKVKLSLFADKKKIFTENTKDTTRKLLELINKYNRIA